MVLLQACHNNIINRPHARMLIPTACHQNLQKLAHLLFSHSSSREEVLEKKGSSVLLQPVDQPHSRSYWVSVNAHRTHYAPNHPTQPYMHHRASNQTRGGPRGLCFLQQALISAAGGPHCVTGRKVHSHHAFLIWFLMPHHGGHHQILTTWVKILHRQSATITHHTSTNTSHILLKLFHNKEC